MSWSMKKISRYKTETIVVVTLVLCCQLLTGTGLFCTVPFRHLSHLSGHNRTVLSGTTIERQGISSGSWGRVGSHNVTPPCKCKRHRKCPAIPRVALTTSPTYRSNKAQRELGSQIGNPFVSNALDYRFALGGSPPYPGLPGDTRFDPCTLLLDTCVLLI